MSLLAPFSRSTQSAHSWSNARPATTLGTLITAGGSANTLGTKVELFASTAFDAYSISVVISDVAANTTATNALVNIYVGASSAEQVLIPTLLAGGAPLMIGTPGPSARAYDFPLFIPAGSRITADMQSVIASDDCRIYVAIRGGGGPPQWVGRGVEAVGITAASSAGAAVTAGTVSEGSFADIGTTVREFHYVLPNLQIASTDTAVSAEVLALDIGVGGVVYRSLEEFYFITGSIENVGSIPIAGALGRYALVPAGTALQARLQSSNAADVFECAIYGVY
jgi:hypothetical protein